MDKFNLVNFNTAIASSAKQFSDVSAEIERSMETVRQINAEKHEAILKTAEFSEKQKQLLEQQLEEVKQQNAQLKENYALLKDLYDRAKQDAEESAKDARKNRVFGWVSFAVGTLIGLAGIVFGVIF